MNETRIGQLHRFMIEKVALEALPDGELSILLGGGKILNELNISTKYLHFCTNAVRASENGPDRSATFTALSFFLRILAGVFEAYDYFRKNFRVDELEKPKPGRLDDAFHDDIRRLNKYFWRTNIILKMRNQCSFHTDSALLRKSLEGVPAEFTYEALWGQEHRNHNIFYGSEIIILAGFQHLKPHTCWEDALYAAFTETIEIADLITKVFERLIESIMGEHLKITMDDAEQVSATDGPPIDTVLIPFFCQPPIGHSDHPQNDCEPSPE